MRVANITGTDDLRHSTKCALCMKSRKWTHNGEIMFVRPFVLPNASCPKLFDGVRWNLVLKV